MKPLHLSIVLALCPAVSAQVQTGDIVVNVFGASSSSIHVYRPNGAQVVATIGGTGSYCEGAIVTASGMLATTRRGNSGFNLFDPATAMEVATFDTPAVSFVPADLDVFADGTLAIADQAGDVDLYTEGGAFVSTFTPPGGTRAFGIDVDSHDHLWIGDIPSVGSDAGIVFHFDRLGNFLGQFATTFEIGDLVVAPDGTIWCADRNHGVIDHLDAIGTPLSSFTTGVSNGFAGLALAGDGTLYATSEGSTQLFHYSPAGALLGQIPLVGATGIPLFIHIVEGANGSPTTYCTAGTSTLGCVAQIGANANPSVSFANACNITVINVEGQKAGIVFYGIGNASFTPHAWASGSTSWLCVKSPTQRTPIQQSGGVLGQCNGSFALDWNAFQQNHPSALGQPWTAGSNVHLQAWYRDPPAPKSTNLSNALQLFYVP
jgi:sugar lactone lactonase YvrE